MHAMHVSLRSQMIAGTAALGAVAIALTPVAQPDLVPSLQRVSSAVQLSALSLVNPITAIGTVVEDLNTDVFNQGYISQDLIWGDYFSNPPDYTLLYAPLNLGAIPDFANQLSTGTLAALVNNLSGYAWAGFRGVGVVGAGVAAAVFNTPIAVVNAVQYLIQGQTQAAIDELRNQILVPLEQGIKGAAESIGYIVDNAIRNVQTVLTKTSPAIFNGVINEWAINGVKYLLQSAIATTTQVVKDITSLNFQAAWNDSVVGFLSKYGTLGQIEQLTAGIGIVQTDTSVDPAISYVASPSIRSVITSVLQRTGDYADLGQGGITNQPFSPSPGPVASVPAASASRTTTPVAAAVAADPAAQPAAGDTATKVEAVTPASAPADAPVAAGSPADAIRPVAGADAGATTPAAAESAAPSAGGSSAATPKAAKHGVSRKAAKAAGANS